MLNDDVEDEVIEEGIFVSEQRKLAVGHQAKIPGRVGFDSRWWKRRNWGEEGLNVDGGRKPEHDIPCSENRREKEGVG
jgi:hypothetical protein